MEETPRAKGAPMNPVLESIHARRSIRRFQQKQVPRADLEAIVEAGMLAPNAVNQQRWHFTMIEDKARLDSLVGIIKENILASGNKFLSERARAPGYHTFYHAPAVVMISGDKDAFAIQLDAGAAAENIALAAQSLGLGSCLMTSPGLLFSGPQGDVLKKELGFPAGYIHVCTVALGYMEGEPPPTPARRRDVVNYLK
jgi:nitroreductase